MVSVRIVNLSRIIECVADLECVSKEAMTAARRPSSTTWTAGTRAATLDGLEGPSDISATFLAFPFAKIIPRASKKFGDEDEKRRRCKNSPTQRYSRVKRASLTPCCQVSVPPLRPVPRGSDGWPLSTSCHSPPRRRRRRRRRKKKRNKTE